MKPDFSVGSNLKPSAARKELRCPLVSTREPFKWCWFHVGATTQVDISCCGFSHVCVFIFFRSFFLWDPESRLFFNVFDFHFILARILFAFHFSTEVDLGFLVIYCRIQQRQLQQLRASTMAEKVEESLCLEMKL